MSVLNHRHCQQRLQERFAASAQGAANSLGGMAGPGETAGETSGGLPLTALVEQILARAATPEAARDQLARLVGATQAIGTELELASALRNVVQVACDLVDARYGAIGVISAEGIGQYGSFSPYGLTGGFYYARASFRI